MLTSEVVERTKSDWLYKGGKNRPAFDYLKTAVDDATLEFDFDGRLDVPSRHAILQLDYELLLPDEVQADIPNAGEYRVIVNGRGHLESDAAAHDVGTLLEVNPKWTNVSILNALKSLIGDLMPWGIYQRAVTEDIAPIDGAQDLPAGTKAIRSIRIRSTGATARWSDPLIEGKHYDVYFDAADGVAEIEFYVGGANDQTRIVYEKDFTLPVNAASDLTADCGLPETLQQHLPIGIAGHLLRGEEIGRLQVDEIRRALAQMGGQVPVGSSVQVGQALIGFFKDKVMNERMRQIRQDRPRKTWRR